MSAQYMLRGSALLELRRIELVLSQLARPTLDEDLIPTSTSAAMAQIGIVAGGRPSRKDLIERLWGRKRSLLRQVRSHGDWGPTQPVA